MTPPDCYYRTLAPIATQSVSTPRFPSPRQSHRKPRSKDLRYNGKSSWKSFLNKFVRLARSEQWTEVEQHDQFCCFALAGRASEYYNLLLETDHGVGLGVILKKFKKCFGSSVPGLTHQLNFNPVGSAGQWRVPPPVARPSTHPGYPGLPLAP